MRLRWAIALSMSTTLGAVAHSAEVRPFGSLGELVTAAEKAAASGEVDGFWGRVVAAGTMPLIFGRTTVFLYRGPGDSVEWRGDMWGWVAGPDTPGERLGATNVWWRIVQLDPTARLDYKIVVDGSTWLVDPLNPRTQLGGYGPNSEIRMPAWQPSEWVERRADVPRGSFTDDLTITSRHLGYDLAYRVWTPPGLDRDATGLASLYVTDGSDYWNDEMGSLVAILDNLTAACRIEPVVVIFVDPWDRPRSHNRRETELVPRGPGDSPFAAFLIDELIPAIDGDYATDRSGSSRGLLGTSLGGLFATYAAVSHAAVFGRVAIQSPALRHASWVLGTVETAERLPSMAFISVGAYEGGGMVWDAQQLGEALTKGGVAVDWHEPIDGHSWGNWRGTLGDALQFLYPMPDR